MDVRPTLNGHPRDRQRGRCTCNSARIRGLALAFLMAAIALPALLASCANQESSKGGSRGEIAPVLAAQVEKRTVPITLHAIGTVEAHRSVAIRARVGGELTRVHFREGQDVREGDLLFSIDARPYEIALRAAEADLMQAKAKATIADLDAQRSEKLAEQELVSRQDHERVIATARGESAAVRSSEADVEEAKLNLQYCSIAAPVTGRTSNLLVQEGNLVRANDTQSLIVINQITPIFVSFSVPERRLPELVRSMSGGKELEVTASPAAGAGEPTLGRLTFVNNAVDPSTGSILLKAEFANEDRRLWPGEFVQVSVLLATREDATVVPVSAVQSGQKGDYVIVVKQDQTAEMRPVVTGIRLDGMVIIEKGVEPGETVVTDGQLRVVPGAKVAVKAGLESAGAPAK